MVKFGIFFYKFGFLNLPTVNRRRKKGVQYCIENSLQQRLSLKHSFLIIQNLNYTKYTIGISVMTLVNINSKISSPIASRYKKYFRDDSNNNCQQKLSLII